MILKGKRVYSRLNEPRKETLNMSVKKKAIKHGGARKGAGRKKKPTEDLAIKISISLSNDLNDSLGSFAKNEGVTKSEVVRLALESFMSSTRKDGKK